MKIGWFKKKNYKKLWMLGDIFIEEVPDHVLYNGRYGQGAFGYACREHMLRRREAKEALNG